MELTKGANTGLRELDEELGSVTVVLETAGADGTDLDADVSVLLLGADEHVRSNDDMVFYNQRVALGGAIRLRDKLRIDTGEYPVLMDTVTINLDDVPDDVERIVLLASLDPSLSMSFGSAVHVKMRVQRSSDGQDLVDYTIKDAAQETALLFGEFYRRDGLWRLRAIGQGYSGGLAHLARHYGVDVDQTGPSAETAVADSDETDQIAASSSSGAPESREPGQASDAAEPLAPAGSATRLSVQRPVRAPKMPAVWSRSIPADDAGDWKPARLFPIAGIGGAEEQEQRATSVLLAVATLVREFGRALLLAMGAPAGTIEAYTEVRFGQDEKTVRPDGVIISKWGQRTWTALIEVKTAAKLDAAQIDSYIDVARARSFDAVIMITNDLTVSADEYPIEVDRRKTRKVSVRHLGWDEIRTIATLCLNHRGVTDPTQRRILAEFLRYVEHPRSGMHGFVDMGQYWVRARENARNKMLRHTDKVALEAINNFDQLVRHVSLNLSGLLGVEVSSSSVGGASAAARGAQFANSGTLSGAIRIPGAVDVLGVEIDVRSERVTCETTVSAPRDGRPTTRVNWLLRQLVAAPDSLRVEAILAGARGLSTVRDLKSLRADPQSILPKDNRDIRAFRIALDLPMNMKRDSGRATVVSSTEAAVCRFYAEVLQHLQRWSTSSPPKLPGSSAPSTEILD
jgi:stress response protein SCP2